MFLALWAVSYVSTSGSMPTTLGQKQPSVTHKQMGMTGLQEDIIYGYKCKFHIILPHHKIFFFFDSFLNHLEM